jgi:hypothetical protein
MKARESLTTTTTRTRYVVPWTAALFRPIARKIKMSEHLHKLMRQMYASENTLDLDHQPHS